MERAESAREKPNQITTRSSVWNAVHANEPSHFNTTGLYQSAVQFPNHHHSDPLNLRTYFKKWQGYYYTWMSKSR